jgi:SAM-dependent methyltransferase
MALTPDRIHSLARGFQASRVVLTAYELGLFSALGAGRKTSAAVARALKTNPRATDRLMNALCALGLLTKTMDQFANAPDVAQFLVKGKPGYQGSLMHIAHLWQTWSTLTEAVRCGRAVRNREINARGSDWLESFITAMHGFASERAAGVVKLLDLKHVARVLDVGGGSGAYSMAFAAAKPGLRATVFDLPNVVPLTQGYLKRGGCANCVGTVAGDFTKDALPSGYDLVFVSAIIHMLSPKENVALLRKCARALNRGGQVVIQDWIMNNDRTQPPGGALFALNMLVGTAAGDTYTEAEVRGWFKQTGFTKARRVATPTDTTLMIGTR